MTPQTNLRSRNNEERLAAAEAIRDNPKSGRNQIEDLVACATGPGQGADMAGFALRKVGLFDPSLADEILQTARKKRSARGRALVIELVCAGVGRQHWPAPLQLALDAWAEVIQTKPKVAYKQWTAASGSVSALQTLGAWEDLSEGEATHIASFLHRFAQTNAWDGEPENDRTSWGSNFRNAIRDRRTEGWPENVTQILEEGRASAVTGPSGWADIAMRGDHPDPIRALEYARRAIHESGDKVPAEYWYALGRALVRNNQPADGLAKYERGLAMKRGAYSWMPEVVAGLVGCIEASAKARDGRMNLYIQEMITSAPAYKDQHAGIVATWFSRVAVAIHVDAPKAAKRLMDEADRHLVLWEAAAPGGTEHHRRVDEARRTIMGA
jgi:hypothetical protein